LPMDSMTTAMTNKEATQNWGSRVSDLRFTLPPFVRFMVHGLGQDDKDAR
jgi:hypothetical protein